VSGLAAPAVLASHDVVLRGVIHAASTSSLRVVAGRAGAATDVTREGLRVGVAPDGEERLALCRPVFVDDVGPFVNYDVVSVATDDNPQSARFFLPTTAWDSDTAPDVLFAMKDQNPTPAAPSDLAALFQNLLARGNIPTVNAGLLLRGTADFRLRPAGDIYFVVRLSIPFLVRISGFAPVCPDPRLGPPPPPGPQPIPDHVMSWTSTRSGQATIRVNGQPVTSQAIRVVGQRRSETLVPRQVLARGANGVTITVDQDDASAGQAPVTTSVTMTVPDLPCVFDPGRPPPLPPR
jgi:hypothetical protein